MALGAERAPLVARALGDLAAVCFTKTPDVGAYSHRVGNECVRALGSMECAEADPELSQLASRVKYVVAKRLVERALKRAPSGEERRSRISKRTLFPTTASRREGGGASQSLPADVKPRGSRMQSA